MDEIKKQTQREKTVDNTLLLVAHIVRTIGDGRTVPDSDWQELDALCQKIARWASNETV